MEEKVDELCSDKSERLEDFISEKIADDNIPGMSISIVEGDELRYAKGFGARDLEENRPATVETLYGIGSCTKSFTALAIMKLVTSGKLDLDDGVKKYLPVRWGDGVTIHHLLTHSSGMPSLGVSEALIDRLIGMDERGISLSDLDDFYIHLNNAEDEIAADPGKRFFYFNSGYALLGQIIEEVTKRSYPGFVKKEVLDPLDMDESRFEYTEDGKIMTPYFMEDDKPEAKPYPLREIGHSGGGLLSSVTELANYLIMNLNGGIYQGENIIDEQLLNKVHTGHIERETGEYGYGWTIQDFMGEKLIDHGGSIAVSGGYLGFTDEYGVAIGCNTIPSISISQIGKWILALLMGKDPDKNTYFKRKRRIERLTGEYGSYRGIKEAEIDQEGGLLRLHFKERLEEQKVMLIPQSKKIEDYQFYYLDGNGERNSVEFDVQDDGNIDLYIGRWRLHKK